MVCYIQYSVERLSRFHRCIKHHKQKKKKNNPIQFKLETSKHVYRRRTKCDDISYYCESPIHLVIGLFKYVPVTVVRYLVRVNCNKVVPICF